MANRDDVTIRILKTGEVLIEFQGREVRRVKDLAAFLEETVGKVEVFDAGDDGSPGGRVELEDLAGRDSEEEKDPQRLRLREL